MAERRVGLRIAVPLFLPELEVPCKQSKQLRTWIEQGIVTVPRGEGVAQIVQGKDRPGDKGEGEADDVIWGSGDLQALAGENVSIQMDRRLAVATIEGQPIWKDNRLAVRPVEYLRQHLSRHHRPSFPDQSLKVEGDVRNGCRIEVGHDLEIQGLVEYADIQAGGNIFINGGIMGNGETSLQAGGLICCHFCQQARLTAGSSVIALEYLMYSAVQARGSVIVLGDGVLRGGWVRAGGWIEAGEIGTSGKSDTQVAVGVDPLVEDQLTAVEEDLAKANLLLTEMEADARAVEQRLGIGYPPEAVDPFSRMIYLVEQGRSAGAFLGEREGAELNHLALGYLKSIPVRARQRTLPRKIEQIKASLRDSAEAQIAVRDSIHKGVSVRVGAKEVRLDRPHKGVTIKLKDGELIFWPLQGANKPVARP